MREKLSQTAIPNPNLNPILTPNHLIGGTLGVLELGLDEFGLVVGVGRKDGKICLYWNALVFFKDLIYNESKGKFI